MPTRDKFTLTPPDPACPTCKGAGRTRTERKIDLGGDALHEILTERCPCTDPSAERRPA